MDHKEANPISGDRLVGEVLEEWQGLIDSAADILGVHAGLITQVDNERIRILLSSHTRGNPYTAGYVAQYPDSDWFCECTLKLRDLHLIADARRDARWEKNPAVTDFGIVSYMGMPIMSPDGKDFGTVCFLDDKANPHNDLNIKILRQVKRMIELSLRVIYKAEAISRQERLPDGLSRIYPICSHCGNIREASGDWIPLERYLKEVTGTTATYGICPECLKKGSGENRE